MNKMKRELTILLLALGSVFGATAQEITMATLESSSGTQIFRGSDAFKEAMEAANHGNMIVLSEGSFNACDITKAVSIYGNGYEQTSNEEGSVQYSTILRGDFVIDIDSVDGESKGGLYMEGICNNYSREDFYYEVRAINNLTDAEFVKCFFDNFYFWEKGDSAHADTRSERITFRECRIANWFRPGNCRYMALFNTYVGNLNGNYEENELYLQNCIVKKFAGDVYATWKNCIMMECHNPDYSTGIGFVDPVNYYNNPTISYDYMRTTSKLYNCIYGRNYYDYYNYGIEDMTFQVSIKQNSWYLSCYTSYNFKSDGFLDIFTSSYGPLSSNILTEEAKATYIGTDSTEVGLYGGESFSVEPAIPRIIYKDIASKTENDKLKVNIKIELKTKNE